MEPSTGIEPATNRLQGGRSTVKATRAHVLLTAHLFVPGYPPGPGLAPGLPRDGGHPSFEDSIILAYVMWMGKSPAHNNSPTT